MKKYISILIIIICMPTYGFAQDSGDVPSVQKDESSSKNDAAPVQNAEPSPSGEAVAAHPVVQPVVLPVAVRRKYTPRPMRQIENREFSNRDKIMLLLSAHCDFPTKEDLISTISFDRMLEDEDEIAAKASMTGRRKQSEEQKDESSPEGDSGKAEGSVVRANNAKSDTSTERKGEVDWRKMTQEERERVEIYLQNILYTILNDESVLLTVRGRSLEALAYFNTEKNIKMLTYILTHSERIKRPIMLVQAIRAFPEVAPEQAAEILAPFLDHENDMVRFVTIRTLQKTPGNDAVKVMQERLDVETNRFFKAWLLESIQCHDQKLTNCR